MNLYFLVEGRRTEKKVYSNWLTHLLPKYKEVKYAFEASKNCFFIFNGNGFPSLLDNHLRNSISEINELKLYDYLIICLDADDATVELRKREVELFIEENNLKLNNSNLIIIVQNRCIETWFLGNRKVYSRQPNSDKLRKYNRFFNVQTNDPELMEKLEHFPTISQFHGEYLSEMLAEKNIKYTKKHPRGVIEKPYLYELIKRNDETNHIASFYEFIQFCGMINSKSNKK